MLRKKLLKTNLAVAAIMIGGFILTAFFSQRANYSSAIASIEQISTLSMDGMYTSLTYMLTKPVHVAVTMSHDTFLVDYLEEESAHMDDPAYTRKISEYLDAYYKKYHLDTAFLVSTASGRYYNYEGILRHMDKASPANAWYWQFLDSGREYSLNLDNDPAICGPGETAVFVNCRVLDESGKLLGVVGIGLKSHYIQNLLQEYKEKYDIESVLVNNMGSTQIGTFRNASENIFNTLDMGKTGAEILRGDKKGRDYTAWSGPGDDGGGSWYVVGRYLPELSWHLVVLHDTSKILANIRAQTVRSFGMVALITILVLLIISYIIISFNQKFAKIVQQRQLIFRNATEKMYENICEWNLSANDIIDSQTRESFKKHGISPLTYDNIIKTIAERQVEQNFREEYLRDFNRSNLLAAYASGRNHMVYDFPMRNDRGGKHWMRIDAYIFHSPEDDRIHMFTYRRNIDEEKRKEYLANMDEMTGCHTKTATERIIDVRLAENGNRTYAFFIFDIDNFKSANDGHGHAFGDFCIKKFAGIIKSHFRATDIIGRLGGDEFAALIPIPDREWAEAKARDLAADLHQVCEFNGERWQMSASIGVALAPEKGSTFAELYKNADSALYKTKENGKNGFNFA